MPANSNQARSQAEGRLTLVINAYNKSQFKSVLVAVKVFKFHNKILLRQLRSNGFQQKFQKYNQKLTNIEKNTLIDHDYLIKFFYIEHIINQLLSTHRKLNSK